VARLREQGLTAAEIAARLGVGRAAVSNMLRRMGRGGALPVRCPDCGATVLAAQHPGSRQQRAPPCLPCLAKRPDATFGVRLKAHRLAAGLTCDQLGAEAGVSGTMITHYETGRCDPTPELLARLVGVLGPGLLTPEAGRRAGDKGKAGRKKKV
jgi:transcriptional regulator with XRE-family HTH domain